MEAFYGPLIEAFASQGYDVHAVTSSGPQTAAVSALVTRLHVVPMSRDISPLADLRALLGWLRVVREVRPEVVFVGTPKAALLGILASWLRRVPRRAYFLQGLRLEGSTGVARRILWLMEWLTASASTQIVAVSPSLRAAYLHLGIGRRTPVTVPGQGSSHGINTEHFVPRPKDSAVLVAHGLDPDTVTLAFIGRLTADKGPDALIQALPRIAEQGERVQVIVVGAQDEPDSAVYRDQLVAAGGRVAVVDEVPDVRPLLGAADILVLPTRREGMPNVVLEASAMGVPVITTDATGAVDSVVDGVTGIIVPVDDTRALAAAVVRLARDPELRKRFGEAGRQRMIDHFQPGRVAAEVALVVLGDGYPTVTATATRRRSR